MYIVQVHMYTEEIKNTWHSYSQNGTLQIPAQKKIHHLVSGMPRGTPRPICFPRHSTPRIPGGLQLYICSSDISVYYALFKISLKSWSLMFCVGGARSCRMTDVSNGLIHHENLFFSTPCSRPGGGGGSATWTEAEFMNVQFRWDLWVESSQTWCFRIQCLHFKPVSNHFAPEIC